MWDGMRIFIHITSKSEDSSCCSRLAEIVLRTYAQTPPFGLNFWWNSNPGQARWLLELEGETCVSVMKRISVLLTWRKWWTESTFLDSPRMLQKEYVRDLFFDQWSWEVPDCCFRAKQQFDSFCSFGFATLGPESPFPIPEKRSEIKFVDLIIHLVPTSS